MLGAELNNVEYIERLQTELVNLDQNAILRWADEIFEAWKREAFVYIIGNGGSGTTASHFAEDLGKSTLHEHELLDPTKKRLKVLSLTDNAGWIMAVGNDVGYDQIFVQQLMNYGKPGDLLIAISGSGNSPNILNAVQWANVAGLKTFGLSGYDGGKLKQQQQDGLHINCHDMGMVESIHLAVFHFVLNDVFARINRVGRYSLA